MTRREIPLLLLITCCGFDLVRSTVCGECQVEPLPLFQNKRVSVGVKWTKTMTNRAECAALCSHFHSIRSFGYKDSSGECVAYTDPLTTPEDTTYVGESGFNMYSTCASGQQLVNDSAHGHPVLLPTVNHFGSCVTSTDCTVAKTTCNEGLCVCDIMHVYSHGSCVQGCPAYGTGFTIFKNKNLDGYNNRIINNVTTIEACLSLCLAETDFLCVTAEFASGIQRCILSSTAWYEVPRPFTLDSTIFDEAIRNCS
ncbi:uncharacterized protein LOC124269112 [Haliotis rubra]|uniref:uncharacterized protein LOC124269112 n=1 Tax=Haliotis rubra TaxID=36100 RepID=UPI001EE5496B|nr:uncharacterized protein LOC124269112 [Haliotis rubra]